MKKIVFFGSSNFSSIILKKLAQTAYCPFLVVTTKNNSLKTNLPVDFFPSKIKEADLFIIASFGKILSKEIINLPKHLSLNIHPSLLPAYRGPSPIQQTILDDVKITGTTIIVMDELIDHGKIVAQKEFLIKEKETFLTLEEKLAELSADLLIETIPRWLKREIELKTQDESKVTKTKLFKKEDGQINWAEPAIIIERKIRAFHPWPGTFTFWQKNDKKIRLKILKGRVSSKNISQTPGKVHNNLAVQSQDGTLIIETIQIEGKKPISGEDFLKGYPEIKNEVILF